MAYASGKGHRPVEIIGHRGSPREARENTIAAFRRAFDAGADGIELDVHGTADGIVVVHHDAITNSRPGDSGPKVAIASSTFAELRELPIGSERIPSLAEVFASSPENAVVYVEVKAQGVEQAVVNVLRSVDRRCAVHSFDHRVAKRVHELAPEIPVGILETSYPVELLPPMHHVGARDLWQQWELIDAQLVKTVQADGGRVIAWTVNDPEVARQLLDWDIDGICSDLPATMRRIADEHGR